MLSDVNMLNQKGVSFSSLCSVQKPDILELAPRPLYIGQIRENLGEKCLCRCIRFSMFVLPLHVLEKLIIKIATNTPNFLLVLLATKAYFQVGRFKQLSGCAIRDRI